VSPDSFVTVKTHVAAAEARATTPSMHQLGKRVTDAVA
jgi:hypothetical protein